MNFSCRHCGSWNTNCSSRTVLLHVAGLHKGTAWIFFETIKSDHHQHLKAAPDQWWSSHWRTGQKTNGEQDRRSLEGRKEDHWRAGQKTTRGWDRRPMEGRTEDRLRAGQKINRERDRRPLEGQDGGPLEGRTEDHRRAEGRTTRHEKKRLQQNTTVNIFPGQTLL